MIGEFDLIQRYFTHRTRHSVLGVGDDAALIELPRGYELAISADMLVQGRHFFADADPRKLGHKALAVNLSDLAAMGATPRWATLALALPRADVRWLEPFARGFMALARKHGVDLIGGDTTRGPLTICVQIMGLSPRGKALRRDGTRVGDDIWVSGELGDAALAVAARKRQLKLEPADLAKCAQRLHEPQPRVALGTALRGTAHSAIDVSDGLLADLSHILERSRVAAEINLSALPMSAVMRRYLDRVEACRALLAGGDDYELCFTAPPRSRNRVTTIGRRLGIQITRIGQIRARSRRVPDLVVRAPDGTPMTLARRGGYEHFSSRLS